jgi:hypothetical protein
MTTLSKQIHKHLHLDYGTVINSDSVPLWGKVDETRTLENYERQGQHEWLQNSKLKA